AARTAVSVSGGVLGTVDSMPHAGHTKQALSQRQRADAAPHAESRRPMPRNVYASEHEDFRASVAEFVERTLKPRAEQMLEVKSVDRDLWKEAGKQGLFGLDIPEEFGGMGAEDYRFNAIAAEVIAGFNFAVSSCFGIH